jgi:beta-lactamase superfamily II metal-dependent hydrolase
MTMAATKSIVRTVAKPVAKPVDRTTASAARRSTDKAKEKTPKPRGGTRRQSAATAPTPALSPSTAHAPVAAQAPKGLRVRMFRVGFGDFFLLTLTTPAGDKHILIDCGVHAKDLKTIRNAVTRMAEDCGRRLSLVIMTHRHADHISGFGTCSDLFGEITVDRVWMPWFENPSNAKAVAFQASLTALASRLSNGLAARGDPGSPELAMARNITGDMDLAGVSANKKALDVLHNGFKNAPAHDYYKAGDIAKLPHDLMDAGLTAQILGPPIDDSLIAQMTKKSQLYLADNVQVDETAVRPFPAAFYADQSAYPERAFRFYPADRITKLIESAQPDVLAAQAMAADQNLNNQSLVVLFGFAGKNLLFAGDAQWGNWENFLYGGAYGTPGHTELTDKAKAILGKIDFYKVGHHGSANATPKDAVAAMRLGCVGMCSTQADAYNEVPREQLLQALRARMNGRLARSDQVAASANPEGLQKVNPDAGPLPPDFKSPTGALFIDYNF